MSSAFLDNPALFGSPFNYRKFTGKAIDVAIKRNEMEVAYE
jgi:hypothetical protein